MNRIFELVNQTIQTMDQLDEVLVGYSINNRQFSKAWFSSVGRACLQNNTLMSLVIVDEPYAFNLAARHGKLPTEEIFTHCRVLGDQRCAMVNRALSGIDGLKYEVIRWPVLAKASLVDIFRDELKLAAESSIEIRNILLTYVKRWGGAGKSNGEDFIGYLIEEIPVFLARYVSSTSVIDVYPGAHFDLYMELSSGKWVDVLPTMTKYAINTRLVCLQA